MDSNFPTINWFILDTDYTTPTNTTYNAMLYDKQNLAYGDHVLNIILQDYRGNQSDIMFDYAAISDTQPGSPHSQQVVLLHGSQIRDTHGATYSRNLGVIIGGTIGALIVLAAMVILLLYARGRKHKGELTEHNLEPKPVILGSVSTREDSLHPHPPLPDPHTTQSTTTNSNRPDLRSTSTSTSNIASSPDLTFTSVEIPTALAVTPPSLNPPYSQTEGVKEQLVVLAPSQPSSSDTPSSGTTPSQPLRESLESTSNAPANIFNARLTDEQADLVSGLWRANVSAADIARVIERMRAGTELSGLRSGSTEMDGDINPGIAPPSYDDIDSFRDEH
jgi:hypothetical protein